MSESPKDTNPTRQREATGYAYFNLSGVTYSTAQYIGTRNTNYYTTNHGYDDRGRLDPTKPSIGRSTTCGNATTRTRLGIG